MYQYSSILVQFLNRSCALLLGNISQQRIECFIRLKLEDKERMIDYYFLRYMRCQALSSDNGENSAKCLPPDFKLSVNVLISQVSIMIPDSKYFMFVYSRSSILVLFLIQNKVSYRLIEWGNRKESFECYVTVR